MATALVHGELDEANTAKRRVNDTLQGPVISILSQFVPELARIPANRVFEQALDDLGLLKRCFSAFDAQRSSFRFILVNDQLQPVEDASQPLKCGRSLDQVCAMIVRTAAKRHFRGRHAPKAQRPILARDGGKPLSKNPPRSRADELYDAIKDHLLHPWQVEFVPTYADMSPSLARALGAKILEIRDLGEMRKIVDDPAEAAKLFDMPEDQAGSVRGPVSPGPKAASAGKRDDRARLSDILAASGTHLRAEAFTATLLKPDVRAQIKDAEQTIKMGERLRKVGATPAKILVAELGLRVDQLTVFLLAAHEIVGDDVFLRIFGQPGNAEMVMRITQKARLVKLTQDSPLADCKSFARELFARFIPR